MNLDRLSQVGRERVLTIMSEHQWLDSPNLTKYQMVHMRHDLLEAFPTVQEWFRAKDTHNLSTDDHVVASEIQHINNVLASWDYKHREVPTTPNRDYRWKTDFCHTHHDVRKCNCAKAS